MCFMTMNQGFSLLRRREGKVGQGKVFLFHRHSSESSQSVVSVVTTVTFRSLHRNLNQVRSALFTPMSRADRQPGPSAQLETTYSHLGIGLHIQRVPE